MTGRVGRYFGTCWPHVVVLWVYAEIAFQYFRKSNHGFCADHVYFILRMLSNRIYFLKNGFFSLPYYTPAFAGGVPQYGNPQDMYFSLFQWFFNLVPEPMAGYRLAVIACSTIAYAGAYLLFRRFGFSNWIASLGGLAFSLNGFFAYQWVVGHISYQSYWAIPWLLLQVYDLWHTSAKKKILLHVVVSSLLIAAMFHASSPFVFLFAIGLSFSMILSLMILRPISPRSFARQILLPAFGSGLMVIGLVATKLVAMSDYLRQFSRPNPNEALGFLRFICLVPNALFNPLLKRGTALPLQIYGWHENGAYSGLTLLLLIIIGVWIYASKEPHAQSSEPLGTFRFFLLWAGINTIVFGYLYIGWNLGWCVLKELPFLSSIHIPSRFVGGMPLVLIGLGAAFLNQLVERRKKVLVVVLGCLWMGDILAYNARNMEVFCHGYEVRGFNATDFRITGWSPSSISPENLVAGFGDAKTYDPIFLYDSSLVETKIDPAHPPLYRFPDGSYNVNNPVSLIYPKETGRDLWSLISPDAPQEQVEKFISFIDPHFFIPPRQKVANIISLLTLLGCLAYLVYCWKSRP